LKELNQKHSRKSKARQRDKI